MLVEPIKVGGVVPGRVGRRIRRQMSSPVTSEASR